METLNYAIWTFGNIHLLVTKSSLNLFTMNTLETYELQCIHITTLNIVFSLTDYFE